MVGAVAAIFLILGITALAVVASIWRGYVLSVLWGWFAVPAFGLPPLSIALAIGVALIVGMLAEQGSKPKETEEGGMVFFKAFVGPAVALLIGWIVTKFI